MFAVISVNGRYAPRCVCDICEKFIEDASMALVVYPSRDATDGSVVKSMHVHKGDCDKQCQVLFGDEGGTDELDTHMAWFLSNIGMKPDEVKNAFEVAAMLDSIG